jgi:hypothetical protein
MATLLCQLTIRAECVEEFENSQRMMFAETNKEKYVRLYQSFRSMNEREYFVIMTFDNYASFIDHEISPRHEEQNAMPMIETIQFHWLDPLEGASDLPPTAYQEIPDPTPLQKKYIDMFQIHRAAWWPKL